MRQEPLIVKSAHRKCLRIIHGNKYDADEETAAKEPALMTDGSGYAATFWTLPEFGCSLWQT
jgi:hypothetical protein